MPRKLNNWSYQHVTDFLKDNGFAFYEELNGRHVWIKLQDGGDPSDYGGYLIQPGDAYTKKTCLWTGNRFIMPRPRPIPAVEGSKMHRLPPSKRRAMLRSETPKGFAKAVFEANRGTISQTPERN
jgi:hypothetical protein